MKSRGDVKILCENPPSTEGGHWRSQHKSLSYSHCIVIYAARCATSFPPNSAFDPLRTLELLDIFAASGGAPVDVCVARPNFVRCVGCFLFPFVALAAYAYRIVFVGVQSIPSYLASVVSGGWNAVSAILVFGGLVTWALITWPKASAALNSGHCTISVDDQHLRFYGEAVNRDQIAAIDVVKRAFDFQLRVRRKDGSAVCKSITLLSPSPDAIAAALREMGV